MAAVAAALGYQPPGSPPVEEMGDEGEEAQDERWYGGGRGEGRNSVGTKAKGSYHPKGSCVGFLPAKAGEGLFYTSRFF